MANPLKLAPWKIPFDVNGSGPYAVRVKLSDLLFDKNANGTPEDPASWEPWSGAGFRLPHDIILYDPSIFGTDGALMPSAPQFNRQTRGFFLTKVRYDERATSTWVPNPLYKNRIPGQETGEYPINNSSAAITPTDQTDFRNRLFTYNIYIPPTGSDFALNEDYYTSSCTVAVEGSQQEAQAFLILTNRDDALEATIPGSSVIPYTRIRANAAPSLQETYDIVRWFTGFGVGDSGDRSIKGGVTAIDTLDPTKNVYLQHVEVWLRCSYFADYVDPKSYNQDLHDQSDVQHRNLLLGTGNFKRFEAMNELHPYLPQTPPREDLLSAELRDQNLLSPFPVPANETPLGWFAPEIESPNDEFAHIVPPDGNIYTSGRVFSPSIDELWQSVKKAISGRQPDNAIITSATPLAATGQQTISIDTRVGAEPMFELGDKLGDPLTRDGSKFVNAGEGVRYFQNVGIRQAADQWQASDSHARINSTAYTPIDSTGVLWDSIETSARWGLRAQPLSLRELEAAIKNEAFNAEVVFRYLTTKLVAIGSIKNGSLFQLHREYSSEQPEQVRWTSPSQTEFNIETQHGDSLPGSISGYNNQSHIDEGDIYLSAEGRWRYLFDHVRIPVLDEQY